MTDQPAPTTQAATVHVDITRPINIITPDTATGAWMDDLSKNQVDNLSKPEVIQGVKNLGWGSITMRNNSELRLSAWHWNENGTWSNPDSKSGYYTGSSTLADPIKYGYSYSLPHRDFMTSGDSPLVAGPQSYWKSNPYLTSHFTGESDALHPQWVVIDMGLARPVDAIHIQWVNPYAVSYVVQYWIGDNNALDWDMGPNGVWQAFPNGTIADGKGGDVHLKLADAPLTTRFIRVLMTQSSNTPDIHGSQDIRNSVGYALQTLSMGTMDTGDTYAIVYPADGTEPTPGAPRRRRGGGGGGGGGASTQPGATTRPVRPPAPANAFPGSADDTNGSFCASSIDPYHESANLVDTGSDMYNGIDNFFTTGLTMHHPALVPVTVIYGTPDDAANEVAYIYKRGYPIVGVEMGEECDGKHTMPEDYAALYIQWADAIHKLTPQAKLGGPVFEGVDKDITLWADAQGRTSWMHRFTDYLKAHHHLQDLAFMSFEHYPFMINGFTPPNDWDTLYMEPGIMKHILQMWRDDGVPNDVPLIISESGITAGSGKRGYMGVTGNAIWECDAFGSFFANGGTAFYRPAINSGAGGRRNAPGPLGGGTHGTPEYTPFTSAHLINFEWLQHESGPNQIYPTSCDLIDTAARNVITSYAVHRPDNTWSLMLINHDRYNPHDVHLIITDTAHGSGDMRPITFTAPLTLIQYANTPTENKNTTMPPPPNNTYTLPAGSITILRGKLN